MRQFEAFQTYLRTFVIFQIFKMFAAIHYLCYIHAVTGVKFENLLNYFQIWYLSPIFMILVVQLEYTESSCNHKAPSGMF